MAVKEEEDKIQIYLKDLHIDRDDVLGRGGFGHVFTGYMNDGQRVAVKLLIEHGCLPKRNIAELQRESSRLKELSGHNCVINLYGMVMEENNYGLVLEYMHFGSSFEFVKDFDVDIAILVRMTQQTASAMMYLHSFQPPMLHLDLKADNVLIDKYFNAKVGDFGLSEWKTVTQMVTEGGTKSSRRCTVTHIAPEVLRNIHHKSTEKLDVYAYGVTIWEIFSAQRPYGQSSDEMIYRAVTNNQRPNLSLMKEGTPGIINLMIKKCWSDTATDRPAFKDISKHMELTLADHESNIIKAVKSIRQQIVNKYAVNEPQCMCTDYIDDMEVEMDTVPIEAEPVSDEREPAFLPPPLTYTPRTNTLTEDDVQLRKHLQNPLALEMVQSGQDDVVPLSVEALKIVQDPVKLRAYIDNDPGLRFQLLRSGSPLVAKLSAPSVTESVVSGKYEQLLSGSLDSLATPERVRTCVNVEQLPLNEQRRVKHAKDMMNCSYMDKVTNNGIGLKVLKALKDPFALRTAVENKVATEEGGGPRFETINSSVLNAAQDPILLQILLAQDYKLLDNLMRHHPDLLMRLISANKTSYKNKGSQADRNKVSQAAGNSQRNTRRNEQSVPEMDINRLRKMKMDSDQPANQGAGAPVKVKQDGQRKQDFKPGKETQERKQRNESRMQALLAEARKKSEEEKRQREAEKRRKEAEKSTRLGGDANERMDTSEPGAVREEVKPSVSRLLHSNQSFPVPHPPFPNRAFSLGQAMLSVDEFSVPENKDGKDQSGVTGPEFSGADARPFEGESKPLSPSVQPPPHPLHSLSGSLPGNQPHSLQPSRPSRSLSGSLQGNQQQKKPSEQKESHHQTPPSSEGAGLSGTRTPPSSEGAGPSGTSPNITISHMHAGGGFSQITMNPNMRIPPNIQVGNQNVMMINNDSDSDEVDMVEEKKPKKRRTREIKLPDQPLKMDGIDTVCKQIGKDWRKLCRELGLEDPQIDQIYEDYHINGVYEVMYQAIHKWMQKKGREATVKALGQLLSNIHRDDLVKKLKYCTMD